MSLAFLLDLYLYFPTILERPRRKWEHVINTYLKEIVYENVDPIKLVADKMQWRKLVNTVINFIADADLSGNSNYS
jgi:hypothetical protein